MDIEIMPVRSRLRLVIAEKNAERIRAGLDSWTIRSLAAAAELSPSVVSGGPLGSGGIGPMHSYSSVKGSIR